MNCHFFQVRSKSAKETLTKRARDSMRELMIKIKTSSSKSTNEIQAKYDELKSKMTTEPETEE
jgi:hypothetical protein